MAATIYPVTKLDADQVIQHVYDETGQRLRVSATISSGSTEVIIDHVNDSIRLGDGVDFYTSTTVGSDVGLDVNLINSDPIDVNATIDFNQPSSPSVLNVAAASAGTEYSFTLPIDTGKFTMMSRERGKIQYSYTSGQSGTNYLTLAPGVNRKFDNLDLTGSITIYFQSTKNSDVLEVEYWLD